MLPYAFFLETPEESLDNSILLRRVRRYELLRQIILPTCGTKTTTLKYQTVIASNDRRLSFRPKRSKTMYTRVLQSAFSLTSPTTERKLIPDDLTIATVDHCRKMAPAIHPAIHMG